METMIFCLAFVSFVPFGKPTFTTLGLASVASNQKEHQQNEQEYHSANR